MPEDIWKDPNLPSDKASAINRDRMKTYGDPTPNMVRFAGLVSALLDVAVTPQEAAMIVLLLKVSREQTMNYSETYPDNLDDICGWANVVYRVKETLGGSQ